jgi:antitoxin component of RelBE/YafQ-DinJ toxin-antitoxin module
MARAATKQENEMSANAIVHARIDVALKVAREETPPFVMRVSNELTRETLAKSERGEDVRRFDSMEAMFREPGIRCVPEFVSISSDEI